MRNAAWIALLLLVPAVAADHPGSNQGLSAYDPITEQLVHRLPDVQRTFERWENDWPDYVSTTQAGSTGVLDFPLEVAIITDESVAYDNAPTATGNKLRAYLDGGHHGNEFLGVDLVMYYAEELLQDAAAEDNATLHWLKTHELHILPIVNVEGNYLDTRKNANQVDVNRNYDFQFGGPGSGSMITDLNYRGPSAFSEPEVLANANYARSIHPDLWITMHSGVAEFYWPWGWTFDKSPDRVFFESLEEPFENATNGRVDAMMAAELYLAAGATDDWGYGVLGVPTHTYEVHEDQFVPIYGDGVPAQIQEQLNGLDFMVMNTMHMGAWLEMHELDGELHIWNNGWGMAANVTLDYNGISTIADIQPGEMHKIPAIPGTATVSYRQLLIDAPEAKNRTVSYTVGGDEGTQAEPEQAPGVPVLVLAAALVALAARRH